MLYCNGGCGNIWLDNLKGCQNADANAYCKLKSCDEDAISTGYKVTEASHDPGFACTGHGTNFGNWFGIKNVWFKDDIRSTHHNGLVVSNVTCQTLLATTG